METRIEVKFDGSVRGLERHRLSLEAFGDSFPQLVKSIRRCASAVLREEGRPGTLEGSSYGGKGGRLAEEAKRIDVEIGSMEDGSLILSFFLTFASPATGATMDMFNHPPSDLPQKTAVRFVQGIDSEARRLDTSSQPARKFLKSLPEDLTVQEYKVFQGEDLLYETNLGGVSLEALPDDMPRVSLVTGLVTAVGFHPGNSKITIKPKKGPSISGATTPEQVDRALKCRGHSVRAVFVGLPSRWKLLRLDEVRTKPLSREERDEFLLKRWGSLLKRMGE